MRIIKHSGTDSWLQVPVKLKSLKDKNLHITIKYFGTAKINPNEVQFSIKFLSMPERGDFTSERLSWMPELFGANYVLELKDESTDSFSPLVDILSDIHANFHLIKDDYKKYRPHITVPKEFWDLVKKNKLTPQSEKIKFGGLEVYLGTGL